MSSETHLYTQTLVNTCIYTQMCLSTYVCLYVYVHTCVCCINTQTHIQKCLYHFVNRCINTGCPTEEIHQGGSHCGEQYLRNPTSHFRILPIFFFIQIYFYFCVGGCFDQIYMNCTTRMQYPRRPGGGVRSLELGFRCF